MQINKDTTLCISLASKPSNFGTRFHNYLYQSLDLNYIYKAFSPTHLVDAISAVRGLPIRGCAISMPYKEEVMGLVDVLDDSAVAIESVNTIVNSNGVLKAYNTDYIAIQKIMKKYNIPSTTKFALKGSGGMAKAVAFALKDLGFNNGVIIAKNELTGKKLAEKSGYGWEKELSHDVEMLINATPVGMSQTACEHDLAFSKEDILAAKIVFDVVALPENTPLIRLAKEHAKLVIQGTEVFALQALEQFYLYTGIYPDIDLFEKAAKFSRQS